MSKRTKIKHRAYRQLKNEGIQVTKSNQVRPNPGSETYSHFRCKACVAFLGQINGYWVSSEVDFPNGKEADILLWGHEDRNTLVVECETSIDDIVKQEKLNNYVKGFESIDDMLMIEVLDLPENAHQTLGFVSEQLGLYP